MRKRKSREAAEASLIAGIGSEFLAWGFFNFAVSIGAAIIVTLFTAIGLALFTPMFDK